jgi:hypothetical protein
MKCFNCENEIEHTSTFCPHCGISILRLNTPFEPFILSFKYLGDVIEAKMVIDDWGVKNDDDIAYGPRMATFTLNPTNLYITLKSQRNEANNLQMQRILGGFKDVPNND